MNPSESIFAYNYNAAFVGIPGNSGKQLLVRCQQNTSDTTGNPYTVSSSVMSLVSFTTNNVSQPPFDFQFNNIVQSSVVFEPEIWYEEYGTEDPRVIYRESNQMYYLLYSAVQPVTENGNTFVNVRLSLATATEPGNWVRQGPIFKDHNATQWSKSGALLCRDGYPGPHYLFYGDSSYVPGLQVAYTTDMINYVSSDKVWMPVRPDSFDSTLVEAGPMPLLLSDGNYLFIYNSARSGYPSAKPGYQLQYNVGWAVLDGNDPTKILARSKDPLMSPELSWEVGADSLTPNVVFVEGWEQVGQDTFILYYGAADTAVGAALLTFTPNSK